LTHFISPGKGVRQAFYPQVKDENNNRFLMKFLAIVGLVVPPTSYPETALQSVAAKHNLLGIGATATEMEALGWILLKVLRKIIVFLPMLIEY